MPRNTVTTPVKTHGGKHYLAGKILELFPARDTYTTYVEPFFGGGSVLLRHDPTGKSEIVNDRNHNLVAFWRTLASPAAFAELQRKLAATPFSETEYNLAQAILQRCEARSRGGAGGACQGPDMIVQAWAFFVVSRQSMSGRGDAFAPASTARTRRGMNEQASAWWGAVDGLVEVHNRICGIYINEGPALRIIKKYDKPGVVMYLDPPYLINDFDGTPVRVSGDIYLHEMTFDDHTALLRAVHRCRHARILLSGYPSKHYDAELNGWNKTVFHIDNKASKKAVKDIKEEVVWRNFS